MPADTIIADATLCRDCQACTLACSLYHERVCSPGLARLLVSKDMAAYRFRIQICRHCDDPACYAACPAGAMRIDDGVVTILDEECIRCGACAEACLYDALFYNEAVDRYLKCDLCTGRDGGPLCVEMCPVGALYLAPVTASGEREA